MGNVLKHQLFPESQGSYYNSPSVDPSNCFGLDPCNVSTYMAQSNANFYSYLYFLLIVIAIMVGCPFLGFFFSRLIRFKRKRERRGKFKRMMLDDEEEFNTQYPQPLTNAAGVSSPEYDTAHPPSDILIPMASARQKSLSLRSLGELLPS